MTLEKVGLYPLWNDADFEEKFEDADQDKDGALDKEETYHYIVDLLDHKLAEEEAKE